MRFSVILTLEVEPTGTTFRVPDRGYIFRSGGSQIKSTDDKLDRSSRGRRVNNNPNSFLEYLLAPIDGD